MIQLFLTLLLLIILIIIINTKESFYQKSCTTNKLYAINAYDEDKNGKKIPCIKLTPTNINTDVTGYNIVLKEKNENISRIINLSQSDISVEEDEDEDDDTVTHYINLTNDNSNIEIGKTYFITLNIFDKDGGGKVYDTIEITFREVNLSPSDLTTKYKCNTDKLIKSLKNKNIVFHL